MQVKNIDSDEFISPDCTIGLCISVSVDSLYLAQLFTLESIGSLGSDLFVASSSG